MPTIRITRYAVAGGAAALCLGMATPALAAGASGTADAQAPARLAPATTQVTNPNVGLEQQKQILASFIAAHQDALNAAAAKVAADPNLTDAQKANFATYVANEQQALSAAKDAISAATTEDALRAALVSAWQAMPQPYVWPRMHPAQHRGHVGGLTHARHDKNAGRADQHKAVTVAAVTPTDQTQAGTTTHSWRTHDGKQWHSTDASVAAASVNRHNDNSRHQNCTGQNQDPNQNQSGTDAQDQSWNGNDGQQQNWNGTGGQDQSWNGNDGQDQNWHDTSGQNQNWHGNDGHSWNGQHAFGGHHHHG